MHVYECVWFKRHRSLVAIDLSQMVQLEWDCYTLAERRYIAVYALQ